MNPRPLFVSINLFFHKYVYDHLRGCFEFFSPGDLFRGLPPRPGPPASSGPATPPGHRLPSKTTSTTSGSRSSSRRRSRPGLRARKATSGLRIRSTGRSRWTRPRPSPSPRASGMEVRCEPQDLWIFVHFLLFPELGNKKKHFGRAGFEPIIALQW